MSTMMNRRCPDQVRAASELKPPPSPKPGLLHRIGQARRAEGAPGGAVGNPLKPYPPVPGRGPRHELAAGPGALVSAYRNIRRPRAERTRALASRR